MRKLLFTVLFFQFIMPVWAQPNIAARDWRAHWIQHPTNAPTGYGVYRFVQTYTYDQRPPTLPVYVSADQRYQLFVNGREVSHGPCRGDLLHWRYETVDIAPFLRVGKNELLAVVWNFGVDRPAAQISLETGFLLDADGAAGDSLRTGSGRWRVARDPRYAPERETLDQLNTYLVVGPNERVDYRRRDFDYLAPRRRGIANRYGQGTDGGRFLEARQLPPMRMDTAAWGELVRRDDTAVPRTGVLPSIPANTHRRLLYDRGVHTTGYPLMAFRGGNGSTIRITYAESLVDSSGLKGNRNEVSNKQIRGYSDVLLPDGNPQQYRPLWQRTWRYLELDITTADEALVFDQLAVIETGYPLAERGYLQTGRAALDSIWNVGWRTARHCAQETYVDCPYYEQLQYVGDTRIQALIGLYVSGDDRLLRRAIDDFDQSRLAMGLTQSRYPSAKTQFIPTYSLFWISMLHDYWRHRPVRTAYLQQKMNGVKSVIDWHLQRLNTNGLLRETAWWQFVDWTVEWPWDNQVRQGGVPAQEPGVGNSILLSFQLAYTLNQAAELAEATGNLTTAEHYLIQRKKLFAAIQKHGYDAERGLYTDLPGSGIYSQHTNILAVLAGAVTGAEARALMERVLAEPDLIQATFYFQFYLFEALQQVGLADRYLDLLAPWQKMLDLGLTTFAEKPDPTRSDCHAWSASPNYHLLSLVAGIRPAAPGFARVAVRPALGDLTTLTAAVLHPDGMINVAYEQLPDGALRARIELPKGVAGTLYWNGQERPLRDGQQTVLLPAKQR